MKDLTDRQIEQVKYMEYALELAEKGRRSVSPNPMVGAVVVIDGEVVGKGYHQFAGGPHAEVEALSSLQHRGVGHGDLERATMYVTLEPCCHYGRTPPCTKAILEAGVRKVVVGCLDPNSKVAGKGVGILRDGGVDVTILEGDISSRCMKQNEVFRHYIKAKRPFVVLKYAMTLDGKIATKTGASKWITGEEARNKVHLDRGQFKGIMVGIGTVLEDDPLLTNRVEENKNPIRIIADSSLRIPTDSKIVATASEVKTIVAMVKTVEPLLREKKKLLEEKGICVLEVDGEKENPARLCLEKLMELLGEMEIDSILLEGGSELNFAAVKSGIVSKVQAYISTKIFGGEKAKSPVGGEGFAKVEETLILERKSISQIGEDILIEAYVKGEEIENVYGNN